MSLAKTGVSSTNGHTQTHKSNGNHAKVSQPKRRTIARFRLLKRSMIAEFRAQPFSLKRADAEEAADAVVKLFQRNHREAKNFAVA